MTGRNWNWVTGRNQARWLVERWEQMLGDLVAERGMALKRQAFLLCGDDAQADDLVQEALVRAFTRPLRALRPGGTEAYVRTIMVNVFIDGTRRQSRWRRIAPLLRPADAAPDPAEQVSARDAVLSALRSLSPRQRACMVLRYYEDLPVAGIARALGLGQGTALGVPASLAGGPAYEPYFDVAPEDKVTITMTVTVPAHTEMTKFFLGITGETAGIGPRGPIGMNPVLATAAHLAPGTHKFTVHWTAPRPTSPELGYQLAMAAYWPKGTKNEPQAEEGPMVRFDA